VVSQLARLALERASVLAAGPQEPAGRRRLLNCHDGRLTTVSGVATRIAPRNREPAFDTVSRDTFFICRQSDDTPPEGTQTQRLNEIEIDGCLPPDGVALRFLVTDGGK